MVTKFPKAMGSGQKVFYLRITETTLKIDSLKAAFFAGRRRADSVVALLSLFAELLFLKTSQEVCVAEQCRKGKLVCASLVLLLEACQREQAFDKLNENGTG